MPLAVLLASIAAFSQAVPTSGQAPTPELAPEVAALDSLSDKIPLPPSLPEVEARALTALRAAACTAGRAQ